MPERPGQISVKVRKLDLWTLHLTFALPGFLFHSPVDSKGMSAFPLEDMDLSVWSLKYQKCSCFRSILRTFQFAQRIIQWKKAWNFLVENVTLICGRPTSRWSTLAWRSWWATAGPWMVKPPVAEEMVAALRVFFRLILPSFAIISGNFKDEISRMQK